MRTTMKTAIITGQASASIIKKAVYAVSLAGICLTLSACGGKKAETSPQTEVTSESEEETAAEEEITIIYNDPSETENGTEEALENTEESREGSEKAQDSSEDTEKQVDQEEAWGGSEETEEGSGESQDGSENTKEGSQGSQDSSQGAGANSAQGGTEVSSETIGWNSSWKYAEFSKAHDSSVTLYHSNAACRYGIVVAVNAGHGSIAAQQVKTQCHPDGSAKVTSGTTQAGATTSIGASAGTTLLDGTTETSANLKVALKLKTALLNAGYDVLMIREDADCSLDNVARTVYANNNADCHIAIHYDSTDNDKGLYYTAVPDISSYRSMEPVASHWQEHEALGQALVSGALETGVKVWNSGRMEMDLTQTSYSTIPSVDLEIGDRGSDHSDSTVDLIVSGIVAGIDIYFGNHT